MIRRPPSSPLFPYTPLFRSRVRRDPRLQPAHLPPPPAPRPPVRVGEGRVDRDPARPRRDGPPLGGCGGDRKSTRLNSSHSQISYAVFCLKKKQKHHCSFDTV